MSLTDLTHRGFNDREEVIDADVVSPTQAWRFQNWCR